MSPSHLSQVIRDMEPGAEVNLEVSRRVTGELQARLTDRPDYGDVGRGAPRRPERPVNYEE